MGIVRADFSLERNCNLFEDVLLSAWAATASEKYHVSRVRVRQIVIQVQKAMRHMMSELPPATTSLRELRANRGIWFEALRRFRTCRHK